jgi:hypothetical protein
MSARRQIIAALSEDSMGGIATLHDVAHAEQLVDAHRTEVLVEVTAWLVKKAREFRAVNTRKGTAQANAVASMASKISRGAVRPDNLRMLPDPGFFEVDRTYANGTTKFRCEAISPSPTTGEHRAIGWKYARVYAVHHWFATALDPDDWEHGGWVEVTEEKATATPAPTATPTVFDPLPDYLHAIGQAGSEYEQALYAAYRKAIAEVARLQATAGDS